jgi:hypothetical protein
MLLYSPVFGRLIELTLSRSGFTTAGPLTFLRAVCAAPVSPSDLKVDVDAVELPSVSLPPVVSLSSSGNGMAQAQFRAFLEFAARQPRLRDLAMSDSLRRECTTDIVRFI